MSSKAVLFGILILLALPAISAADDIFVANVSGTEYCGSAKGAQFKETLFFKISGTTVTIAFNDQFSGNLGTMSDGSGVKNNGSFSFADKGADRETLNGTYKRDKLGNIASLTGTIDVIINDCRKRGTFKAKRITVS